MGTDNVLLNALGLAPLKITPGLAVRLRPLGLSYLLGLAWDFGLEIVEALEAESGRNVRYYGVHVRPLLKTRPTAQNAPKATQDRPKRPKKRPRKQRETA